MRLRVDAATARTLRLASRTVGTTSLRRASAGRTTTTVRVSRRVARRLAARRGARYSVVATVTSASGRSAVLSRRAALTG